MDFTKTKFLSLKTSLRHKKASECLRDVFLEKKENISVYKNLENWLELPEINLDSHEEISCRFHLHLKNAGISWKEHSLLHIRHKDTPSLTPFLPIHIFLSCLRSAFNVGSILRTTEAFRLGTVHFCNKTPTPENPKVQKASMGTYDKVPIQTASELNSLPRPWIALETASPSTSIFSFDFPETFTLILGNEEFGVTKEILEQCDAILEIPLYGSKNSLNVASAFAIAAGCIRQPSKKTNHPS